MDIVNGYSNIVSSSNILSAHISTPITSNQSNSDANINGTSGVYDIFIKDPNVNFDNALVVLYIMYTDDTYDSQEIYFDKHYTRYIKKDFNKLRIHIRNATSTIPASEWDIFLIKHDKDRLYNNDNIKYAIGNYYDNFEYSNKFTSDISVYYDGIANNTYWFRLNSLDYTGSMIIVYLIRADGSYEGYISNPVIGQVYTKTISTAFNYVRLYTHQSTGRYISANFDFGVVSNTNQDSLSNRVDRLEDYISNKNPDAANSFLPYEIRYTEEIPLKFYKKSMVLSGDNDIYISGYSTSSDDTPVVEKLDKTDFGTGAYKIFLNDIDDGYEYGKSINVVKSTSSSMINKSPKLICIGDSLTNRGVGFYTKKYLNMYCDVNTLCYGTMTNHSSTLGEGREGWGFANFIGKNNIWAGNRIYPQTTQGSGALTTNPFLKLATSEDKTNHPAWCFRNTGSSNELSYSTDSDKTGNFYIFDFANYLSVQQIPNPDIVSIGLSRNDVGRSDFMEICSLALEIMIKQIKSATSSCKVVVIPAPVQAMTDTTTKELYKKLMNWHEQVIKMKGDELSNITDLYILSIHAYMPVQYIFPLSDTPTAVDSSNIYKYEITDTTHWGDIGKKLYGRALASFIGSLL